MRNDRRVRAEPEDDAGVGDCPQRHSDAAVHCDAVHGQRHTERLRPLDVLGRDVVDMGQ